MYGCMYSTLDKTAQMSLQNMLQVCQLNTEAACGLQQKITTEMGQYHLGADVEDPQTNKIPGVCR